MQNIGDSGFYEKRNPFHFTQGKPWTNFDILFLVFILKILSFRSVTPRFRPTGVKCFIIKVRTFLLFIRIGLVHNYHEFPKSTSAEICSETKQTGITFSKYVQNFSVILLIVILSTAGLGVESQSVKGTICRILDLSNRLPIEFSFHQIGQSVEFWFNRKGQSVEFLFDIKGLVIAFGRGQSMGRSRFFFAHTRA